MDFTIVTQTLIDSMAVIITAFVGLGVVYLKGYINKRIENEEFKNSLRLTAEVVGNSVKASISNLGENVKVAVADGKVSKQDISDIENAAFKHFNEQVSPKLQERLQAHIGDVQTLITNKIAAELQKAEKVTG